MQKYFALLIVFFLCNNAYANTPKPVLPSGVTGGLVGGIVAGIVVDKANDAIDWVLDPENHRPETNPETTPNPPPSNYTCRGMGFTGSRDQVATAMCHSIKQSFVKKIYTHEIKNSDGIWERAHCNNGYGAALLFVCGPTKPQDTPLPANPIPDFDRAPEPDPAQDPSRQNPPDFDRAPEPDPAQDPSRQNPDEKPDPEEKPAKPDESPDPEEKPNEPEEKPDPEEKPAKPDESPDPEEKPNNPNTPTPSPATGGGGGIKLEFPKFCDWATVVCDWIEWSKEEPELEPEPVPTTEIELKDPSEFDKPYLNAGQSCPADVVRSFNTGFATNEIRFEMRPICDFASTYVNPVVVFISYVFAVIYIGGAFKVG